VHATPPRWCARSPRIAAVVVPCGQKATTLGLSGCDGGLGGTVGVLLEKVGGDGGIAGQLRRGLGGGVGVDRGWLAGASRQCRRVRGGLRWGLGVQREQGCSVGGPAERLRGVSAGRSAFADGGFVASVIGASGCARVWVGVSALGTVCSQVLGTALGLCQGVSMVVSVFVERG